MIALAYLGLMILVGDALCRRWFAYASLLHRLATAFLVGLLASTWLTYLVSLAASSFDQPLLAGDAVMLGAIGPIVLRERWPVWRSWWQRRRPAMTRLRVPAPSLRVLRGRWDWIVVAGLLAFVSWMMFATLGPDGAGARIGVHEVGDFGPNLAIAQSFAVGHNFPTEYPLFVGEPIHYHFLFYFQVGNLTFLGLNPALADNLLSIGSMVAMLVLVMALGQRLFRSAAVGRVGALLFFFHGSLSFVPFLASFPSPSAALAALPGLDQYLSSIFPYRGEAWAIWTQNVFLNQRHLAGGIGILLVALLFVVERLDLRGTRAGGARPGWRRVVPPIGRWIAGARRRAARPAEPIRAALGDPATPGYVLCGLLLGLLPLWNEAVFAASAAVLAAVLLIFPNRVQMLLLGIAAGIVSLPQIAFLRPEGPGYSLLHWGFVVEDATPLNVVGYLAFLFGPKLLLAAVAFILGTGLQRRFFLAIASLVAVTFTTQFSTDIFNNHKFLTMWLILVNLYVGFALVRLCGAAMTLRGRAIPRLPRRLVATGLLLVILTGGAIDLIPIRNDPPQLLAMAGDPLYDWVRQETDPRSVFLTDIYIHHPILRAGRGIFYGWPAYPLSLGYDMASRELVYRDLLTSRSPRDVVRTLQAEGIDYVAIDDGLREGTFVKNLNEEVYRNNFAVAYADLGNRYRHLVIYRVPTDPYAWESLAGAPPVDMFTGGAGTEPGRMDGPRGIAAGPLGVVVADTKNHRIQRFALDGAYVGQFGQPGSDPDELNEPNGVGIDSLGDVFVVDSLNNQLLEYDQDGRFVATWGGPDAGFYGPRDISVGPDDTLYILDQGHARVVKRMTDGSTTAFGSFGAGDGQLNDPTGVATGAGLVVVADPTNRRIVVFDTNGRFLRSIAVSEWGKPFEYPDVLVAADGQSILASSPSTNEVLVFGLDGRRLGSLQTSASDKLEGPSAMAERPTGGLFVIDFPANRVTALTP